MSHTEFNDYVFRFLSYIYPKFPNPQPLDELINEIDSPFIKRLITIEMNMGFTVLPVHYTSSFQESVEALMSKIKYKHASYEDAIRVLLPISHRDYEDYIANKDRVKSEIDDVQRDHAEEIKTFHNTIQFLVDEGYVREKDTGFVLTDRGHRDLKKEVVIDQCKKSKADIIKERIGIANLHDGAQLAYNVLEIANKLV